MLKLFVLVILILFSGCNGCNGCSRLKAQQTVGPQRISPTAAYQIMSGESPFLLLDVRSYHEFREGRIEGAILIPEHEIRARAERELPDRNMLILVYCRSGIRSARAAGTLAGMGYTNVYDFGGINDWPYEVER